MHQILQNLANGQTELADIPCPQAKPGQLLIRTHHTLVSAGNVMETVVCIKNEIITRLHQTEPRSRG